MRIKMHIYNSAQFIGEYAVSDSIDVRKERKRKRNLISRLYCIRMPEKICFTVHRPL